jgi:hypothetical protein
MRAIGITIIVISVAILLLHSVQEFLAISACFDSGQVYDYSRSECRSDIAGAPYIPYFKRFSWLNTGALLAMLLGVACALAGKRDRQ